jgi:hypothetical protein
MSAPSRHGAKKKTDDPLRPLIEHSLTALGAIVQDDNASPVLRLKAARLILRHAAAESRANHKTQANTSVDSDDEQGTEQAVTVADLLDDEAAADAVEGQDVGYVLRARERARSGQAADPGAVPLGDVPERGSDDRAPAEVGSVGGDLVGARPIEN